MIMVLHNMKPRFFEQASECTKTGIPTVTVGKEGLSVTFQQIKNGEDVHLKKELPLGPNRRYLTTQLKSKDYKTSFQNLQVVGEQKVEKANIRPHLREAVNCCWLVVLFDQPPLLEYPRTINEKDLLWLYQKFDTKEVNGKH